MPLKVIDSCTTRNYVHTWIHFRHVLYTNIMTMTHAITSNTNSLSIDITRTHTQMRKSPRGEKEREGKKSGETQSKKRKKTRRKEKREKRKEIKKINE